MVITVPTPVSLPSLPLERPPWNYSFLLPSSSHSLPQQDLPALRSFDESALPAPFLESSWAQVSLFDLHMSKLLSCFFCFVGKKRERDSQKKRGKEKGRENKNNQPVPLQTPVQLAKGFYPHYLKEEEIYSYIQAVILQVIFAPFFFFFLLSCIFKDFLFVCLFVFSCNKQIIQGIKKPMKLF